jgi:UDP-glucose 4-epimerase
MSNEQKMRCIVFGGCGFIGSHVAEKLVLAGLDVAIFDKLYVRESNIEPFRDRVRLIEGDFANETDIESALDGIDIAFHFVGTTLPQTSMENPVYDIESNLIATVRMLEVCVRRGVRRVVFSSSGGTVYGIPEKLPISEEHPTRPMCSYGVTKLAVEKYIALYHRLHGLDYRILRFSNPYGPRQAIDAAQGAVAVFLGHVLHDSPITIWGDGSVKRDYIYIGDTVEACVASATADIEPGVYNIGSGRSTSLNELLDVIKSVTGKLPEVKHTSARRIDVPENVLDVGKIKSALNWSPQTSLHDGIEHTWKWLKERGGKR